MKYTFKFTDWEVQVDDHFLGSPSRYLVLYPEHKPWVAEKLLKELGLSRDNHPFRGPGTMPENRDVAEQFRTLIERYESLYGIGAILSKEEIERINVLNI